MKTKDFLHKNLSNNPNNNKVFQKTYQTIGKLSREISVSETRGFGITDKKEIANICAINAKNIAKDIIDLVNYTIENFEKNEQ
tara:strand:+ start:81 stop:329 length:249 start_codon:yes stop_codon:yes gene_type:complete